MSEAEKGPATNGKARRRDNYRLYRPEAVSAHATRGAGEPWEGKLPLENALLVGLTLLVIAGFVALHAGAG